MSAEEAAARVEYPLTFDVLGTSRRFSDTTLSGPDLINTHDPSTTSSGLWSDFDDPRTDDTAGWIDKFAAMALSEAVHEALEWFRVDGQQYLDPHGCQADAINAEVTALCARLALLRQGVRVVTGPIQGPWAITSPGVFLDMPDAHYHADPVVGGSVSNSGVKLLLKAPKKWWWENIGRWQDPEPEERERKDHLEFGSLAHAKVLGVGAPVVERVHDDARTKLGKLELAEIQAAGGIAATRAQLRKVDAMAKALADDPVAGTLFTPGRGTAERVLVAWDDDAGVYRRAKIDWTTRLRDGSAAYVDYKSASDADPANLERTFWNFGYHRQDAFYSDTGALIGEEVRFLFVVQEKEAPYLVTVAELDDTARQWGRVQNRKALDIYRLCTESGQWPGYASDVVTLGLPGYAERDLESAWESGALRVVEEGEV